MKKIILTIGCVFCLMTGVVFSANAYTTITYKTFPVVDSPFVIEQAKIITTYAGDTTVQYQYYLKVIPELKHMGMQRVEYVGFRVVYNTGALYYQLFPNGMVRQLTDVNQALYEPSSFVSNPQYIGRYQLFSQPININLMGGTRTNCIRPEQFFNIPGINSIEGVNIIAGYGFLTQENKNLIAQQKAIENDPVIQAQRPQLQLLDIKTMKLAIAQGNMFVYKEYYPVLDLSNFCEIEVIGF